jgi:hypothetical protein
MPFGWRPAPRIILTWTAEILAILRARGMRVNATTDDFIYAAPTADECDADETTLVSTLTGLGFAISEGKSQKGQQVDYVGFRFDSVRMTVSVMPDRANWFRLCLHEYVDTLRSGGDVPHGTWSHVCGKLEDYAMLSQDGKTRVSAAWLYHKFGQALSTVCRGRLLDDLAWWDAQLEVCGRAASPRAASTLC